MNIDAFSRIANSAFVTSRDIAVQGEGDKAVAKLGNYIFSQGSKTNDATMSAFKAALEKEYGVFGTHAFDTYVGTRNQLHLSLRVADVRKVLSNLTTVKAARVTGELVRQLVERILSPCERQKTLGGCHIAPCTPRNYRKSREKRTAKCVAPDIHTCRCRGNQGDFMQDWQVS